MTKYRRRVFTDAMLTFTEHTMRAVCADLDVELVEFNRSGSVRSGRFGSTAP